MAWAMHISPRGINLIKEFEGLKLVAYRCPAGVWTIGYGTTRDEHGQPITAGRRISEPEAHGLLVKDLDDIERRLNRLLTVEVSQGQFDALCSFAYNVGLGQPIGKAGPVGLEASTLLRKLNAGDRNGAAAEFPRWNKAGGKVLPGLTRRREAERALFMEE